MWLRERRRDVLRIGRQRTEYWTSTAGGLVLQSGVALGAEPGEAEGLEAELRVWLATLAVAAPRASPVDVVLESAWSPVMLMLVGRDAWGRDRLERLLRHRIADLYQQPGTAADDWVLQLDHRPGDVHALGFGLAPSVRHAVLGALSAAGRRAASLQPALSWARKRLDRRGQVPRSGWWVWSEQDRALVCRIERGRITAMNAAAAVPADEDQARALVAVEAARWGEAGPDHAMVLASWRDLQVDRVEGAASSAPRNLVTAA